MKEKFKGYFIPNKDDVKKSWNKSIFIFDTNVLLSLYEVSGDTSNQLMNVFKFLKNKVWFPYQVVHEYVNKRLRTIENQAKSYHEISAKIIQIRDELNNNKRHPFLKQKKLEKYNTLSDELLEELKIEKTKIYSLIKNDPILEELKGIIGDNIGDDIDDKVFEVYAKEAAKRADQKLPPGYKDFNKKDGNSNKVMRHQLGDFIIWKEIIGIAKMKNLPVIFITGDLKEDWWLLNSAREIIQPRPELIQEFYSETGQDFYMYELKEFLDHSKEYFELKIKDEAISELRNVLEEKSKLTTETFYQLNEAQVQLKFIESAIRGVKEQINNNIDFLNMASHSKSKRELLNEESNHLKQKLNKLYTERELQSAKVRELSWALFGDDQESGSGSG